MGPQYNLYAPSLCGNTCPRQEKLTEKSGFGTEKDPISGVRRSCPGDDKGSTEPQFTS